MRVCLAVAGLGVAVWMGVLAHTTAAARPALQGVKFVGACAFSHMAMDDPIVYPRQPGASHDHSFVGDTTTNAFSTLRTLRAGSSTCKRDGETAASVAYPTRGTCPASHPVALPAISLIYRYPITGGSGVTLSSGGRYSAHADFFNAWRQGALVSLVNNCLNALRHCGRNS